MYSVESLAPPYCYAAAIMCRIFGNDNSARFLIHMVPLIHAAINSKIMDWSVILSDKMANRILDYRKNKNSVNMLDNYKICHIKWWLNHFMNP